MSGVVALRVWVSENGPVNAHNVKLDKVAEMWKQFDLAHENSRKNPQKRSTRFQSCGMVPVLPPWMD